MIRKLVASLAVLLLGTPLAAEASVIYTLSSSQYTLTYESSDFITSNTSVTQSTPGVSSTCEICTSWTFYSDVSPLTIPPTDVYDGIGRFLQGGGGAYTYFANGAFGAFGTYTDVFDFDDVWTLTVARGADAAVPEPGTLVLLALGLAGAGMLRRRRAI